MGGYAEMKLLFIILCFFFYCTAIAKTIPVGNSQQYKTITAGINAAAAGDTVMVEPGFYKEQNLLIKKSGHCL